MNKMYKKPDNISVFIYKWYLVPEFFLVVGESFELSPHEINKEILLLVEC